MRSKFEVTISSQLTKLGVRYEYEKSSFKVEVPVRGGKCLKCGGPVVKATYYTPDFFLEDGTILESKGKFTSKDRTKMALFKEQYPDVDLRMVFMRDNKLSRTSNTRYSDWAERVGYKYAIGKVTSKFLASKQRPDPSSRRRSHRAKSKP